MSLEQLKKLTAELEKCLDQIKKEQDRSKRMLLFSQFLEIHSQIKSEI
jgi:hypothetical protein